MSFSTGFGGTTSTPAPAFSFGVTASTTATPVKPGKLSTFRLSHISFLLLLYMLLFRIYFQQICHSVILIGSKCIKCFIFFVKLIIVDICKISI